MPSTVIILAVCASLLAPAGPPADEASPSEPAAVAPPPTATSPEATRDPSCPSVEDLDDAAREARADEAISRAVEAFSAGNDSEALAAIDTADCYAPRPAHQYMRGAILRKAERCDEAIARFDAFLAQDVPAADAEDARRQRDECEQLLAELAPASAPEDRPAVPPPRVTAPMLEDDGVSGVDCPPSPGRDGLAIGLLASGGLLTGAGIGMVAGAHGLKNADRDALSEHDSALETARRLNPAGWAMLGTGAALLAGGIVRVVVVKRRRRQALENLPAQCRPPKFAHVRHLF